MAWTLPKNILSMLFCAATILMAVTMMAAWAADLAEQGRRVATEHCARCHVVSDANRMGGIDSTPSFKLLRGMKDWEERYSTFFVRNPHPSFMTVEGLSVARTLPPNAQPVILSASQVEALMAFVRGMPVQ